MEEISVKKKRDRLFQFVLTKDELREIMKAANESHMSASAFIRYKVIKKEVH